MKISCLLTITYHFVVLAFDKYKKVIQFQPRRADVSVTQLSLLPQCCASADPQMLPSTHDSSHIVLPSAHRRTGDLSGAAREEDWLDPPRCFPASHQRHGDDSFPCFILFFSPSHLAVQSVTVCSLCTLAPISSQLAVAVAPFFKARSSRNAAIPFKWAEGPGNCISTPKYGLIYRRRRSVVLQRRVPANFRSLTHWQACLAVRRDIL